MPENDLYKINLDHKNNNNNNHIGNNGYSGPILKHNSFII